VIGTTLNPVLGIVDAGTNTWVANVPTAVGASKVAADPTNQQIFVALTDGAVGVFTRAAFTPGAPLGSVPVVGPAGPAGPAGPVGPEGSGGGCTLTPGAAFDPILVSLMGLMGVHLGLGCLSRRRGKARRQPSAGNTQESVE
jgi:hypothetical protein